MYTYTCSLCLKEYKTSSPRLASKENVKCYECKSKKVPKKDRVPKDTPPKDVYVVTTGYGGKRIYRQCVDIYHRDVCQLTETQDLSNLKDFSKRGFKGYHLDHIVPISYGRKHNIPPELIASLSNLRFISRKANLKKKANLIEEAKTLLKEWGYL